MSDQRIWECPKCGERESAFSEVTLDLRIQWHKWKYCKLKDDIQIKLTDEDRYFLKSLAIKVED